MPKQTLVILVSLILLATGAPAQQEPVPSGTAPQTQDIDTLLTRFSDNPDRFTQTDGEALYRATCQACHMEDGEGAVGAGAHPPLAGNPKLNSKYFLAGVILTGYNSMPRFGNQMSDDQVAAVTNYVRNHFGNDFPDEITPDEVADLRPPDDGD